MRAPTNDEIGDVLERLADLLESQHENPFRVRAYRRAAATARTAEVSLADLLEAQGKDALIALPNIGKGIAAHIEELAHTGRIGMLSRLEGEVSPEDLFTTVPGIGEVLAHAIHAHLGIETLEELEAAAHDGRLAEVPGFGPRRAHAVRDILAGILGKTSRRHARERHLRETLDAATPPTQGAEAPPGGGAHDLHRPSVDDLLDFDAEYRERAQQGQLRTIAPRRFNPSGEAWLPVMHGLRDGWSLTALFSNTARAHELGRTRDWVVIYFERDGDEDQCTVVTEHTGPLEGLRVVRGREAECRRHYAETQQAS